MKYLCTENKIHIMNETIILKKSAEIDLNDSFFKSLKETILSFRLGSIRNQKMGVKPMFSI